MSRKKKKKKKRNPKEPPDTEPDWTRNCENCGATPVVGDLNLCGPCCFGEADTMGGNW